MRVGLRVAAVIIGSVVVAACTAAVTASFRDGPFGPFPGGALERGPLVRGVVPDAETVARVGEVELQLRQTSWSRFTWIVEHEGSVYIPYAPIAVPWFKRWPLRAIEDGPATLRVLGRRYEGSLERVADRDLYRATSSKVVEKYGGSVARDELWIFRFEPAAAEGAADNQERSDPGERPGDPTET